ncbi:CRISPR-associated endonuclease Cas2 [uncultured Thiodictyon sp.]|jgi:CRISPR-associated protein Cas2|uniref:CRISPR-associated endonuclease Cas2 n=1 Tax=uncultured Thiodictyon sp. TaxID=1846217 RepID=UPI0025D78534|nr:CRISPR-associated endonuclease Cas2 [uncultured Thiodictyon sp.]
MEVYVASFDISDDRLRRRVGDLLLRYGERVQRSVFEIIVRDRRDLDMLREDLRALVGEDDDIRFYRICAACRQSSATLDGGAVAAVPAVVIL